MRRPARVRDLEPGDLPAALALCEQDPVGSVLASSRLVESGLNTRWSGAAWGAFEGTRLVALAWAGANLVPVSPGGRGLAILAQRALHGGRRFSSLVGEAAAVDEIWMYLSGYWPRPRQIRRQPSLAIPTTPRIEPDPRLRLSHPAEADLVLPASVAMFTEEYGYSPISGGGGYAARVRQLVDAGRSFVVIEEDQHGQPRVLYKAEIGAEALGVAQLQGVWVEPSARGAGLGSRATAAVVRHVLSRGARVVSLYVNDYNAAARATYRRVGFEQVGEYVTIVL